MPGKSPRTLPQVQLREIVAEWVRVAMGARGWNQSKLARAAGISRQTISEYLTGKVATVTDDTVQAIASALEVDPPRLAADPFHLGVGDRAWFEAMAERYRRAAAALE